MQTTAGALNRLYALPLAVLLSVTAPAAGSEPRTSVRAVVDRTIRQMMARDGIPGAAVAVIASGGVYVFDYGVASKATRRPVARDTLFEIGSVTKTFTATLTSWAQVEGRLSLSDDTAKYVPSLAGTPFGAVSVLDLATHTPGGVPLQVPRGITTDDQLLQYLKNWRAVYPPGTYRTYSNVGIGVLGMVAEKSWNEDFVSLMEHRLFPALGMNASFVNVPPAKMIRYAEGYTDDGTPVRMSTGMLWPQTYGVRSTAADLARYLQANMGLIRLGGTLERAITQTHTGYFQAGPMTQDLVWEQYPYPVALSALLKGNSSQMLLKPNPVTKITPPLAPNDSVWIDKTGSTNGFGAYVAFVPARRLGIVILANKSFPIADRVTAAYRILTSLAKEN